MIELFRPVNPFKRWRRNLRVEIVCPHGEFVPAAYGPAVRATGRFSCDRCPFEIRLSTFRGQVAEEIAAATESEPAGPPRSHASTPHGARPAVRIDPAVRFGAPHIRGISCEAIADIYAAGEGPEVICDDYAITRHELVLALWQQAQHGTYGDRREEWKVWAGTVQRALGGWEPLDVDTVPLPELPGEVPDGSD